MIRFALGRLVVLALSLGAASLVVFAVVEVAPGDPAAFMLGTGARPDTVAALRAELGLDLPLWQRYLAWTGGLLTGDLGISYTYRAPVSEIARERLAVSGPLALYALALTVVLAFPAGIVAASRARSWVDTGLMGATQVGVAIPNFWFAMLMVWAFAITFRLFPSGGFPGWDDPLAAIRALTLPAIALALPQASILARVMRGALLETMSEDYVRTARAKGLSRARALRRHALRNALIPVLTILGLQFAFLLAGGIVIEQVFYLPGLGRLIFQAIGARDLIVVESVVMLLVAAVIVVNFAVEIAYAAVDPRLRRPA